MNVEVLIAGAGIAGMTLAMTLHRAGMTIAVADKPRQRVASRVAAGIINPLPGRRFAPAWNADAVMDEATEYWTECGYLLGREILTFAPILRFFHEGDANFWNARRTTPNRFVNREFSADEQFAGLRNSEGGVIISGGRADIPAFLTLAEKFLRERGVPFIAESVLVEECQGSSPVQWQDITAQMVVWCEGWRSAINPLWSHLPFVPAKGEILTIRAEGLDIPGIAVRKALVAPTGEPNTFRAGATYKWNFTDEEPTVEGREELQRLLVEFLSVPYSVVSHEAGVRPALRDVKPVVGRHRTEPRHWIFNGLGAKGAMLAPYCARRLADMLQTGNACDPAIDALRFG